jgi:hypothetical protein
MAQPILPLAAEAAAERMAGGAGGLLGWRHRSAAGPRRQAEAAKRASPRAMWKEAPTER